MAPSHNLAVPKGSTVLVTGVNGLLGSHTADQFLEHGYKVRGTVRDTEKNAWLQALFDKKYGKGSFELFKVSDLTAEGAFDEAVKGMLSTEEFIIRADHRTGTSIVAHSASIVTFAADPNAVIPPAIAFALNALKSAYKEASVKRFVLTSSSSAAIVSDPAAPGVEVTEDSWSEAAVKAAWADPPYNQDRGGVVYAASKTESEQAVWKYHKENRNKRPDLVVNTGEILSDCDTACSYGILTLSVLPNFNFGKSLDPVNQGYASSSALPVALWQGQVTPFHHMIVPRTIFILLIKFRVVAK